MGFVKDLSEDMRRVREWCDVDRYFRSVSRRCKLCGCVCFLGDLDDVMPHGRSKVGNQPSPPKEDLRIILHCACHFPGFALWCQCLQSQGNVSQYRVKAETWLLEQLPISDDAPIVAPDPLAEADIYSVPSTIVQQCKPDYSYGRSGRPRHGFERYYCHFATVEWQFVDVSQPACV